MWVDVDVTTSPLSLLAKMIEQIYLQNKITKLTMTFEWDLMPPTFLPMEKLMWFWSEACINFPTKLCQN